jgi:hypothetical protein
MYFSKPMPSLNKFSNVTSKPEFVYFKTKNKQDFHVKSRKIWSHPNYGSLRVLIYTCTT